MKSVFTVVDRKWYRYSNDEGSYGLTIDVDFVLIMPLEIESGDVNRIGIRTGVGGSAGSCGNPGCVASERRGEMCMAVCSLYAHLLLLPTVITL